MAALHIRFLTVTPQGNFSADSILISDLPPFCSPTTQCALDYQTIRLVQARVHYATTENSDKTGDLFDGAEPVATGKTAKRAAPKKGSAKTAPKAVSKPPSKKASKSKGEKSYTASDIEVLEGLEPVRRRPGMYIGGTDMRAMHHLFAEVIDNSMDEAVAGHASFIEVEVMGGNTISVRDNGRGIP